MLPLCAAAASVCSFTFPYYTRSGAYIYGPGTLNLHTVCAYSWLIYLLACAPFCAQKMFIFCLLFMVILHYVGVIYAREKIFSF